MIHYTDFSNITDDLTITAHYTAIAAIGDGEQNTVEIYPSVVTGGWLYMKSDETIGDITLFDLYGKELLKNSFKENNCRIYIGNIPRGVCIVKMQNGNNVSIAKKIVVQ